ncbi:MAG: phage gp6-like head-tail connector protein [Lactococcus lactis]|nr:phage gp6-like head-tail connector protein [Lactococcus lactis]
MNTFLNEFKARMRIFHESEDNDIIEQLDDSKQAIIALVGEFKPSEYRLGKELIFERTRYVRNEALEYFNDNFQTDIFNASLELMKGDEDAN